MPLAIGLAGYGAVAAVHARRLPGISCVYGPNLGKAREFARREGIAQAADRYEELLAASEAVIIASPSGCHFDQAREALERGVSVLVELPPCASEGEAQALGEAAAKRGLTLRCAHTSRYLEPYRLIRRHVTGGLMGATQAVQYIRCLSPRQRSWEDDALLHHAAHPVDLFLDWFPGIEPVASVACPPAAHRRDVCFLFRDASGFPVSGFVSYSSRHLKAELLVVGERYTLATDGFSYVSRDGAEPLLEMDATEAYEAAIGDQDAEFIEACRGAPAGVPWPETVKLLWTLDRLTALGASPGGRLAAPF